jgi:hypothetical protein
LLLQWVTVMFKRMVHQLKAAWIFFQFDYLLVF